jgi:putative FmdB family regulatory protein
MPFYQYDCGECGSFEEFRSMARFDEPCDCPECGRPAPRQLSAAALGMGTPVATGPAAAAPSRPHRTGCGCCTTTARKGLKAEAAALGAPKRAKAPASTSFLDRP